jgi:hypothetical protein
VFVQVDGYVVWCEVAVCKPSAQPSLVQSNTCHHQRNGPLAAETRSGGLFLLCRAVHHGVSPRIDGWQCPRTHSERRPGGTSGAYNRSLCTSAVGRSETSAGLPRGGALALRRRVIIPGSRVSASQPEQTRLRPPDGRAAGPALPAPMTAAQSGVGQPFSARRPALTPGYERLRHQQRQQGDNDAGVGVVARCQPRGRPQQYPHHHEIPAGGHATRVHSQYAKMPASVPATRLIARRSWTSVPPG